MQRMINTLIFSILLLGGAGFLVYAPAAQWIEQFQQNEANKELADTTKEALPEELATLRADAEEYNNAFASGLSLDKYDYETMLSIRGQEAMARLRIPSILLDQTVRHGMDETAVSNGVGHSQRSSLPAGGTDTRAVLGSHRGLAESKGFTDLPKVEVGDLFYIDVLGETLVYKVFELQTVTPEEADRLMIEPGRDLVTLLTCTPLGINSHRIIATGERVSLGDVPDPPDNLTPGFPWWILVVIAAVVLTVLYARRRKHSPEASGSSPLPADGSSGPPEEIRSPTGGEV